MQGRVPPRVEYQTFSSSADFQGVFSGLRRRSRPNHRGNRFFIRDRDQPRGRGGCPESRKKGNSTERATGVVAENYRDGRPWKCTPLTMYLTPPPGTTAATAATLQSAQAFMNDLPHASVDLTNKPGVLGSWVLEAKDADINKIAATLQTTVTASGTNHYRLKLELIDDIFLVCTYSES